MNKKVLLSTITIALLNTNSFAKTTQQEIEELKAKITDLEEYIEEVEENLGKVETRSYSDKIQFGLGMRVEANNISTTYADGSSPTNEDIVWRTKFYLNMKSKIANNLKFTGRLSSYKNWGDSSHNYLAMTDVDSRQGRVPDDSSALYVERAYLDWYMTNGTIPLTLTLGRQPSSDGPSFQIKEGTTRKGTYDALAFDGAADGLVLTANLSKVTPGETALRIAYGVPNNANDYDSDLENMEVLGFFLDRKCPKIKAEHLIQAYYVTAKNLNANPRAFDTDKTSPTYMNVTGDKNIGDFVIYGAMFEIQHIKNFDFFFHYSHSTAKPNGNTYLYPMDTNGDGTIAGGEGMNYGLLSTGSTTEEKNGHAIWTGFRYSLKDWAFGAEYNKGSKYWFSATYAPNEPLNKLATRGDAKEFYITKKINKHANIRVGYLDINYDYTGSGMHLGEPLEITDSLGTKAVKERQNAYITFNVLF